MRPGGLEEGRDRCENQAPTVTSQQPRGKARPIKGLGGAAEGTVQLCRSLHRWRVPHQGYVEGQIHAVEERIHRRDVEEWRVQRRIHAKA